MYHILCVDDNPNFLFGLKMALKKQYQVSTETQFGRAMEVIKNDPVDLVLLDVDLGGADGVSLLSKIRELDPSTLVIMLSGERNAETIVRAMRAGAADYLCKPYPTPELKAVIEKNLAHKNERDRSAALLEHYSPSDGHPKLVGKSAAIQAMVEKAGKLKGYDSSILIEGESGTGKEVLAQYLHSLEDNAKRPFIAVNCAAIPDNLLESELFGHEKGAFTGAIKRKIGKFELAAEGDIFLDEINSLKPDMQAKLLRVLQEKEFYRVGGDKPVKVNVRIIAASNSGLVELVQQGVFRQDLYYRLRVILFEIPALRERIDDLGILVDYFLYRLANHSKSLSEQVFEVFRSYQWPGNIRELQNLLESLCIMSDGPVIQVSDLPNWVKANYLKGDELTDYAQGARLTTEAITGALKDYMRQKEVEYIKRAIRLHNGNVSKTAQILKVSRSTIYNALNRQNDELFQ